MRVAELKARLSEFLRAVRRGEIVTVHDRDEPIATIVPYVRAGAGHGLQVREPRAGYGDLGNVPIPPPADLPMDVVELLVEERRRH